MDGWISDELGVGSDGKQDSSRLSDIWIDDVVPCLKDTETGELLDTVVFKIESRS